MYVERAYLFLCISSPHCACASVCMYLCIRSQLCVCVCVTVDEGEAGVRRFMREVVTQWRSLSVEVRSVRSMLEEVLCNWERYSTTVASLQAWLEDGEAALSHPENTKRVRHTDHY